MLNIFALIVLIFSVMIHEIAHGSVAYSLGDPTAKYAGRLTLNPLKHIDPFGSIFLPLFLFLITRGQGPILGWAKPVPINPYNFRDQKWGELKVSLAGPATNLLIALVFGLMIRFPFLPTSFLNAFAIITAYNLLLGIFNLVPVPPLDGSHVLFTLLGDRFSGLRVFLERYSLIILLILITVGFSLIFVLTGLLFSLITGHSISAILG